MKDIRKDRMIRLFRGIALLLGIIASIGFAQSLYAQTNDKSGTSNADAVVYFYRYRQFVGYTVEPFVYCNEVPLARMGNGRYFKVVLSPGTYTFRSNDKQSGMEIELKGGEQYYIRVEIAQGLWKQYGRLVLMAKEQGSYEIKKLKPLGTSKIKDRKRVVVDEQQQQKQQ
ncbi:MAG TPA: DUF2846 domain-containing protein [Pyrinomonadaceae bacterium]|jgi:hypothetical protein